MILPNYYTGISRADARLKKVERMVLVRRTVMAPADISDKQNRQAVNPQCGLTAYGMSEADSYQ